MVFLLHTESAESTRECTAGGWPGLEDLRWLCLYFSVLSWGWLEGRIEMGLLTEVSTSLLQHGSLKSSSLLHSSLGLPESVLKQKIEAAPSLRLGLGNWCRDFCHVTLLRESESFPDSKEGDTDATPLWEACPGICGHL